MRSRTTQTGWMTLSLLLAVLPHSNAFAEEQETKSGWSVAAGKLRMNIKVPANTTATVYVPAKDSSDVIESNKPAKTAAGVKFLKMENGSAVFLVESGSYFFEVAYDGEKQ